MVKKIIFFKPSISFWLILFTALTNLIGQNNEIRFSHLTSEDGLIATAVTKICQDSKGFMWFGTYGGLNRYNGYKFDVFKPDSKNPHSLSNHSISSLLEDSEGYLWIGTFIGLNRFDPKSELFYSYMNNPNDITSISSNRITTIFEDHEKVVWIGTSTGLNKFNRQTNNFTVIRQSSKATNEINNINCIEEDSQGNIWYGTWDGLFCINKNGRLLRSFYPNKSNPNTICSKNITTLYFDNKNYLWIGTSDNGIDQFNTVSGNFKHFYNDKNDNESLSNNYISTIHQDKYNNIWIGTKKGLNKFNWNKNNFERILHNSWNPWSLNDDEILTIYEDRTGLLWIGTEGGLNSFIPKSNNFQFYTENKLYPERGLSNNRVNSIIVDSKNNLWIGTRDGLDEKKYNEEKIIKFSKGTINHISNNSVCSILEDKTGVIWVGTSEHGLTCFDPASGQFRSYMNTNDPSSISNNGILSICEDHNGFLWFATWWGLNKFDRKTGKFQRYLADHSDPNGLKDNLIWDVFEDSDGMIWLGTENGGLSKLDPNTGRFSNFIHDPSNSKSFVGNRVFKIFESSDKLLWICTSNGLNQYNKKTGNFTLYNKINGLPSDVINSIQEDNKGNLWISTDKGLSRFDRNNNIFTNYNRRNGLPTLEFSRGSSFKSKDGFLYFGSNAGLIYFYPDSIKDYNLKLPVVLTGFKIYNQDASISHDGILKESISYADKISIPYSANVITFEFALPDYYNLKSNKFIYRLFGFEHEWNSVGSRNTASYTNLPPGDYTFVVRAFNDEGVKNANEVSLKLIVLPPFYMTWWFRLLLVISIILTVGLIIQSRTFKIKKQNSLLENKVAERTRDLDKTIKELNQEIASKDKFFSIIAHDLRGPFTGVIGLVKYLNEELDSLTSDDLHTISEGILKSTQQTYDLLENLLNWARIKTGRISFEKEEVSLAKILQETSNLFKENITAKRLCLNIYIDEDISVYADPNMVKAIFRNLISNSIKFTDDEGSINISSKNEGAYIKTIIKDTGVGISQDRINRLFQIGENISTQGTKKEKGTGLGLILCKEFIELNRGKISVKSKPGAGSEFSFTLPAFNKAKSS